MATNSKEHNAIFWVKIVTVRDVCDFHIDGHNYLENRYSEKTIQVLVQMVTRMNRGKGYGFGHF